MNRKGLTMVELIVTMTLIILFAAGTTLIIGRGYRVFIKIRGMNEAVQVSDLILDKVEGELEGAILADGIQLIGKNRVEFSNANGSPMFITDIPAESGAGNKLLVNYKPVNIKKAGDDTETVLYGNMRWMFDEKAYMGFHIEELQFTAHMEGYPDNVIRADVKVSGPCGAYQNERYIRCYNYDAQQAISITTASE